METEKEPDVIGLALKFMSEERALRVWYGSRSIEMSRRRLAEATCFAIWERVAEFDRQFGKGLGATRERERLKSLVAELVQIADPRARIRAAVPQTANEQAA